jgi:hypothetical protein
MTDIISYSGTTPSGSINANANYIVIRDADLSAVVRAVDALWMEWSPVGGIVASTTPIDPMIYLQSMMRRQIRLP